MITVIDNDKFKTVFDDDTHLWFSKIDGTTLFWGRTKDEDPSYNPHGNDILDLEVSSANTEDIDIKSPSHIYTNHGCKGLGCQNLCYKAQNKEIYYEIELDNGNIVKMSEKEAQQLQIGDEILDIVKETYTGFIKILIKSNEH